MVRAAAANLFYSECLIVLIICLSVSVYSGTHGYMAPEVLAKGVAYDSSADWFSFGCMLYKLLRGSVADILSTVPIGYNLVLSNKHANTLQN